MNLIACITFGHTEAGTHNVLGPAVELAGRRSDVRVVSIDDASGLAPEPGIRSGIEFITMPQRSGFPAVVNHLASVIEPSCRRLVLVNPDALADSEALERLLGATSDLAVPAITDPEGHLENLRPVTTSALQLRALMVGERAISVPSRVDRSAPCEVFAPPFAPQGAVISIGAELIRELPLDPTMFWLEMSDWVLRWKARGKELSLAVTTDVVEHAGASTSASFPVSVAASQARAKVAFVRRYGSRSERLLVPLAVLSRAVRFALLQRSARAGYTVFRAALGSIDWRVAA